MALKIEQFLQILPNYTFPDSFIKRAMERNAIPSGSDAFSSAAGWNKKRDLAEAMMWDFACTLSTSSSGARKQIGNRSYSPGSLQATAQDKAEWRSRAKLLRSRWGINTTSSSAGKIRDVSFLWGADTH